MRRRRLKILRHRAQMRMRVGMISESERITVDDVKRELARREGMAAVAALKRIEPILDEFFQQYDDAHAREEPPEDTEGS
jgi:hypothetical protein